ncbi:hypothetical protein SAMN05216421_0565 [Halopseudomonas xinjiangensis]|uniref:Uncharacterized protein n=1 Tax=Halopseudomonas xinjiangensis TaxID=487184 RepID=A0A1H1MYG2_9GAMM|nr:hypothetical protein [Halopseudomonas xinjiangensis]SDR91700.1 hypothetical protein SAMN05216421_0565 [Halopseudomonas xinjiangensis]
MKVMTTLSTAIAFASLALAGSDALAQSESARKQASGQSATHATPAAPHADVDQPGVGGTQGANSGTNTSAGPEGASIRPTNQGAAEAGMANSTMDKEMKSKSKSGQSQGQSGAAGASTSSQKSGSSQQSSGSGATSASGATGAAGNSARAGGGMDDPARTADRSGVTGAPDEIEREQRDIERPSE